MSIIQSLTPWICFANDIAFLNPVEKTHKKDLHSLHGTAAPTHPPNRIQRNAAPIPATLRGLTASRKCEARSTLQRRLSSTLNFAWSLGLGAKRAFCGIQATSNTFSDFKVKIVGERFNEQLCPRPCFSLSMHFYAYAGLVYPRYGEDSAKLRPQDQAAALCALCEFYHIHVPIDSRPAACAE